MSWESVRLEKASKGYGYAGGGYNIPEIKNYLLSRGVNQNTFKGFKRKNYNDLLKNYLNPNVRETKRTVSPRRSPRRKTVRRTVVRKSPRRSSRREVKTDHSKLGQKFLDSWKKNIILRDYEDQDVSVIENIWPQDLLSVKSYQIFLQPPQGVMDMNQYRRKLKQDLSAELQNSLGYDQEQARFTAIDLIEIFEHITPFDLHPLKDYSASTLGMKFHRSWSQLKSQKYPQLSLCQTEYIDIFGSCLDDELCIFKEYEFGYLLPADDTENKSDHRRDFVELLASEIEIDDLVRLEIAEDLFDIFEQITPENQRPFSRKWIRTELF